MPKGRVASLIPNWIGPALAVLSVLLFLFTLALLSTIYRQRQRIEHLRRSQPMQSTTPSADAFSRYYRRAYEALTEPDKVAALIDDPVMKGYLTTGGIKQKGELYEVTASLIRVNDGKAVDSTAVRNALIRG